MQRDRITQSVPPNGTAHSSGDDLNRSALPLATRRPWFVEHDVSVARIGSGQILVCEIDCSYDEAGCAAQAHADADLIVEAVNNYEALVAAVEEAYEALARGDAMAAKLTLDANRSERWEPCRACGGSGDWYDELGRKECPSCHGDGGFFNEPKASHA